MALCCGEDAELLILLIAWLPVAASVVFVVTIRYRKEKEGFYHEIF